MSTLAPSRLYDVSEAETFLALTNTNFGILAEESGKRVATYSSGVPTTLIGPPTSGAHVQHEFWRDALGGEFVCTVAGTPGTWKQSLPAPVTTDPSTGTIPTGYLVLNVTTGSIKRHSGSYVWAAAIPGVLQIGDGINYTQFAADGTMTFVGTATVFDDVLVPITSAKLAGVADPSFAKILDDGAGSTGIFTYLFSATQEKEVFFQVQLPHKRKSGSDIYPHVHWMPTSTNTGSVVWGLEYSWANINGTFGNSTIVTVTDPADGTLHKHQYIDFGAITGTGKTFSSILMCRLFRKAADGADTYTGEAALLAVDFHVEIDKLGDATLP